MTYKEIGIIVKSKGTEGNVVLKCPFKRDSFFELEHVFIELQSESYIPFFPTKPLEYINPDLFLLQLDDINTLEEARPLLKKKVFIEEEKFGNFVDPQNKLQSLPGFVLEDKTSGNIAQIKTVTETHGHLLAAVQKNGKEFLLPLSEDFITYLDINKKKIEVQLPEGIWKI